MKLIVKPLSVTADLSEASLTAAWKEAGEAPFIELRVSTRQLFYATRLIKEIAEDTSSMFGLLCKSGVKIVQDFYLAADTWEVRANDIIVRSEN